MATELPPPNNSGQNAALLGEYDNCQDQIDNLETRVWQSAVVFIVSTFAGLGLLVGLSSHDVGSVALTLGATIFVSLIYRNWTGMLHRWWSQQSVIYYRMQEIDGELGLYRNRYLRYKDERPDDEAERAVFLTQFDETNRRRFANLDTHVTSYSKRRAKDYMIGIIRVLYSAWIVLALVRLAQWAVQSLLWAS